MIPTRGSVERKVSRSEQRHRPKKRISLSREETEAGIKKMLEKYPDSALIDRADICEEEKYMIRMLTVFHRSGGCRID